MSYLQKIKENNNYKEEDKTPFLVEGKRVGQVRNDYLEYVLSNEIFVLKNGIITLAEHLKTFKERTKALTLFAKKALKDGITNRFMNENYPLSEKGNSKPLAFIDRSISTLLGSRSFGQHLNAYVITSEGMKMWIGRRAYNNPHHAGKLDHLVAGGLPYDILASENLKKECYEEAGMSKELASQAKSVGLVSYKYEYESGGKEDVIYCYDIELSENFIPKCTDGEVEEFYLMPIQKVAELVRTTDEFKPNCNLVIIDFLVRHGFLIEEDEDYIQIVQRLRS
jgi:8-oxo-dGTP pyrophosphatase MutT (NUDIX family)